MMDPSYSLLVACFDDEASAQGDFAEMKSADDLNVVAAVVLTSDPGGRVEVTEHGGRLAVYGTAPTAVAGLVVGLFAPGLLPSAGVGVPLDADAGAVDESHEEKQFGMDAAEWLPAGSSAIVAVVDDVYLHRSDAGLQGASKTASTAIEKGAYERVVDAVHSGDEMIVEAIPVTC